MGYGIVGSLTGSLGLVLGTTEIMIARQGNLMAGAIAPIIIVVAIAGWWVVISACRARWIWLNLARRRIVTRLLLGYAAVAQVVMLLGIPATSRTSVEDRAAWAILLSLCLTLVSAITLMSRPKIALTCLGITAAYAFLATVRTFHVALAIVGPAPPILALSEMFFTTMTFACITAFILAWPLPYIEHSN